RLHPLRRRPDLLLQERRGAEPRPVPVVGRSGLPAGGVHRPPGQVPRDPRLAAAGGHRDRSERRAANPPRAAAKLPGDPPQLRGQRARGRGEKTPDIQGECGGVQAVPPWVRRVPEHGPAGNGGGPPPPGERTARRAGRGGSPGHGRGGEAMSRRKPDASDDDRDDPTPPGPQGADRYPSAQALLDLGALLKVAKSADRGRKAWRTLTGAAGNPDFHAVHDFALENELVLGCDSTDPTAPNCTWVNPTDGSEMVW